MLKNGHESIFITVIAGVLGLVSTIVASKNPIFATVIFVICLGFIYLMINKSISNTKRISHDQSNHPVFYTIEHCISSNLWQIPLTGKKKELVVLYLRTKMEVIRDILLDAIEEDSISKLPIVLLHVNERVKCKISNQVPDIFFERISDWDLKNNAWTLEPLSQIIESEYYFDKTIKYTACFDCVQVMVRGTIVAVENTIKSLNGELDRYFTGGQ
jgi:hypothetical protein